MYTVYYVVTEQNNSSWLSQNVGTSALRINVSGVKKTMSFTVYVSISESYLKIYKKYCMH